jgi:hypothetical protein
MTNAERQRRKRAKARKRKQSAEQAVAVERMLAPKPVVVDGPMLKVEHLRMDPVSLRTMAAREAGQAGNTRAHARANGYARRS